MNWILIYKDLTIWYFIIEILGIFTIAGVSSNAGNKIIFTIIFIEIYFALILLFFISIAMKRMKKVTRILTEECKVSEYLEKMKKLCESPNKYVEIPLKRRLALGYLYLGKYEENLKTLKSIKPYFKNTFAGVQTKMAYYNDLSVAYLQADNIEKASEMLNNLKSIIIETNKVPDVYKQNYMLLYQKQKMALDLRFNPTEENYKKAEIIYLNSLERVKENIEKVVLHRNLAKIYEKLGKKEQQEKSIEYVLKNGGETYMVQEVKNMKI